MHIIISLLGTIVTLLYLLSRLADAGIDLAGLNPFLWRRRRAWKKLYTGNPIFQIKQPMELTALLCAGLAKLDGDLSREDKQSLLSLFVDEFSLTRKDAADLLIASNYLLQDGAEFKDQINKVMQPSLNDFSPEQIASAVDLLQQVAILSPETLSLKTQKLAEIESQFNSVLQPKDKWDQT